MIRQNIHLQVYLCLLLIFAVSTKSFSQESYQKSIDLLKEQMQQATYDDSAKLFELGRECIELAKKAKKQNEIGYVYQLYGTYYYFSNDVAKATSNYNKSIQIAKRENDLDLQISTEVRKNYILMDTNIGAAEKEFNRLLYTAVKNKFFKNQVVIYNGLGILSENSMKDKEALKYYQKGYKIAEKYGFQYEKGFLLNNIGLFKINHKNYEAAKIDLKKALEITKNNSQARRLRLNIFNNLGLVYKQTNNIQESIKHYKQTLVESKKLGFPTNIAVAMINLGSSYYENSDFNTAMKYCDTIIELSKHKNLGYLINAQLLKSLCLMELNKIIEATQLIESVKSQKKHLNTVTFIQLLEAEIKLEEVKGNYKLAYQLEKNKNAYKDSVQQITNGSEVRRMQVLFDNERIATEVKILQQKNNILSANNQLKDAKLRSFIMYFLIGFICIVSGIYIFNIRKERKTKAQFSQRLIEKVDNERSRISKDLHDDIGQSLAVVKSKVNLFNSQKTNSLEGLESEIGDILEKTRTLSHRLHSSILEKIGLEKALNELLNKAQNATTIFCSLDYELENKHLSLEVSSHVYHIAQECISNTIKHSNATALKISVYQSGENTIFLYQDNGIGFSTDTNKSGIGLQTIQERATIIGGKIDIKSSNQKGVTITIQF